MRRASGALLDSTRTVVCGIGDLARRSGLFFIFVWSPHPWGWHGIDQYHELARALARGEPFGTTDVPWGYAYYLAFFYWRLRPHAWVPLVGQVLLNASVPLLLYRLVAAARRSARRPC